VKKIPMRSCVVTHEKLEKKDLFRIVRNNNQEVFIDDSYKANGRGAYLKKDKSVIEKAQKSKILDRSLNIKVSDDIYNELINRL
jgi:uncharacterized protein